MKCRFHTGFTLIDLVVSIGILGMLTSVTMRAINPGKQLLSATDAVRLNAAKQLQNAFNQYLIAQGGAIPTTQKPIPTGEANAKQICRPSKTSPGCVNLDAVALTPTYIPSLPMDEVEPCSNYIGYKIYRDGNLISIKPANLGKKKDDNLTSDSLCGDGLVAQWSFESAAGSCAFMTFSESAGVNNLHLDHSCGTLSTDVPTSTLFTTTRSLQLNGTVTQYAERATFSGLDTASTPAFTITGWIKLSDVTNNRVVIAHFPKPSGQTPCVPGVLQSLSSHYEVYVAATTGQLRFYSGNIGDFSSNVNVADNQWRHFAVTYDYNNGKTLKFYINGVLTNTVTAVGSGIIDADAGQVFSPTPPPGSTVTCPWHLMLGGQPDLYSPGSAAQKMPFFGLMDEIQIYKKAIGLEMIQALAGL